MDSEYDHKFMEMKKYIPFLENMIKRLERTNSDQANPRQAQLDKIRSLRDLLLDKKKRMKMENLLKCEQVLINLYAKVEQKETLPGIQKSLHSLETESSTCLQSADISRNKIVSSVDLPETLPEIARANETVVVCTPGSKEPALFQNRPDISSELPLSKSPENINERTKSPTLSSKRNYTRILVSPEPTNRKWSTKEETRLDKNLSLFNKRSPTQRSPRKSSPSYKKERKKSSKPDSRKRKNLITLNVPGESMHSLNKSDIFSRIINCSDKDVDINTLRELRSQILGELKHTGSNEDISDLILKSYTDKTLGANPENTQDKTNEIEEGEITDSESETIEKIYGSLVLVDKDNNKNDHPGTQLLIPKNTQPRKIQICLVINSDKDKNNYVLPENYKPLLPESSFDVTNTEISYQIKKNETDTVSSENSKKLTDFEEHHVSTELSCQNEFDSNLPNKTATNNLNENNVVSKEYFNVIQNNILDFNSDLNNSGTEGRLKPNSEKYTANFYKPLKMSEIPLLNAECLPCVEPPKKDVFSEIDILQALKKEILSEPIAGNESEITTPPLHQPKLSKVFCDPELSNKKKISLEKYKQKSLTSNKGSLSLSEITPALYKDENSKRQSLKLTEKECERFNFPPKLALEDSSEDEDKGASSLIDDVYNDLAPKSPDNDDNSNINPKSPILIPADRVKTTAVEYKTDIDMRSLPLLPTPVFNYNDTADRMMKLNNYIQENKAALIDPQNVKELDNQTLNKDILYNHQNKYSNSSIALSSRNPHMTPNRTPLHVPIESDYSSRKHVYAPISPQNESYNKESTKGSLNLFENCDKTRWHERFEKGNQNNWDEHNSRHGYARNYEESYNYSKNKRQNNFFDKKEEESLYSRQDRSAPSYYFGRSNCSSTPSHPFGTDPTLTPSHSFGRSGSIDNKNSSNYLIRSEGPESSSHIFSRSEDHKPQIYPLSNLDCPLTPSHHFGRSECPSTPNHTFDRNEFPSTPSHPFGRSDCPPTPSHSFGRSDCPPTPSHPFGRSECPSTPSHSFGRSDCPSTPSHQFGRSDNEQRSNKDPRLHRNYEHRTMTNNSGIESKDKFNAYHTNRNSRAENRHGYFDEYTSQRNIKDKRYFNESDYRFENNRLNRETSVSRVKTEETYQKELDPPHLNHPRFRDLTKSRYNKDFIHKDPRDQSIDACLKKGNGFDRKLEYKSNSMSVKPHIGRDFTIDTSVNRTFQNFMLNKGLTETTFIDRRRRASSVGRTFLNTANNTTPKINVYKKINNVKSRTDQFVRAQSVGREISNLNHESNHSDIKKDFENYKQAESNKKRTVLSTKEIIEVRNNVSHIKKEKNKINTMSYSPRKNYRDPRLHQERKNSTKSHHSKERNISGINYSDDNIAKGAILGKGYGVKHYKIPKIKRLVEEKPLELPDTVTNEKDDKINEIQEKLEIPKTPLVLTKIQKSLQKNDLNDSQEKSESPKKTLALTKNQKSLRIVTEELEEFKTEKRVTRSSGKSELNNIHHINSEKKKKQSNENIIKSLSNDTEIDSEISKSYATLNLSSQTTCKNSEIDSSFSVEDLDLFSDNICPDPVIDNISALIADLDDDIDTSKSSTICKNLLQQNIENQKHNIAEQSDEKFAQVTDERENTNQTLENELSALFSNHTDNLNDKNEPVKCMSPVVSTSCSTTDKLVKSNNVGQSHIDISTPDSTNAEEDKDLNLVHDLNSTPSHDINCVSTSSNIDVQSFTKIDEVKSQIGNILSILQDKTKIKELLSMMGNDENEKLKKKLEKLSEIVSEEDEQGENIEIPAVETTFCQLTTTTTAVLSSNLNKDKHMDNEDITSAVSESLLELRDAKILTVTDNNQDRDNICSISNHFESEANKDLNTLDADNENQLENTDKIISDLDVSKRKPIVRGKYKTKRKKKIKSNNKNVGIRIKRNTRSKAANSKAQKQKTKNRELESLHKDIKEMFISEEVLNATGIRLCRLAKLVDDQSLSESKDVAETKEIKPVVLLEKFSDDINVVKALENENTNLKVKNIGNLKLKVSKSSLHSEKFLRDDLSKSLPTYKPGPKSKTKLKVRDPYVFDTDSFKETETYKSSESFENSSGSDDESSDKSNSSSEPLVEIKKKPKRKRGVKWQTGVIVKRKNKKKVELTQNNRDSIEKDVVDKINKYDVSCFTDKSYCFLKNVSSYSCKLCSYKGEEIVKHYKNVHPHSEIPLSRMSPETAKKAIEQCEEINFQAISKISTERYTCRFCYKEFYSNKTVLEVFFLHIVNTHTGEFKQLCSECIDVDRCPFNLDIPPLPKNLSGQLIGYICGKCNFTQISLENLKSHVIVRHNDEQTEVYTINLADMTKKTIKLLSKRIEQPKGSRRSLRSSKSNQSFTEASDDRGETSDYIAESLNTNITNSVNLSFCDNPDNEIKHNIKNNIKIENEDNQNNISQNNSYDNVNEYSTIEKEKEFLIFDEKADDILKFPHFKISFSDKGIKEYICCINGNDNHYKTSLLISLKKHIRTKHVEPWDGYCFVCKVIVMPQGTHAFNDCLQHFLDNHMDNFPKLEEHIDPKKCSQRVEPVIKSFMCPPKINVRPLSDLVNKVPVESYPKIESVVSLGTASPLSPYTPSEIKDMPSSETSVFKYEEVQADIMGKKHSVVLESMMSREKLVHVFKCAGRYCSYSTNSVEDALMHASTHQKVGGENSLLCPYCNFDCTENARDLVMHVFKQHGSCYFSCSRCFYRASASQLVASHISRLHANLPTSVFYSKVDTPVNDSQSDLLSRQEAVELYSCKYCSLQTYTPGKFCKHIELNHKSLPLLCSICDKESSNPNNLINHYKSHGMKLYHCTWCLFGADNEDEMTTHASIKHPDKQPQAYLRIITSSKVGAGQKILPLVHLNKQVAVEQVTAEINTKNAIREATCSLELEKLISHTNILTGSSENIPTAHNTLQALETDKNETLIQDNSQLLIKPVIKCEFTDDMSKNKHTGKGDGIICISDEEDSKSRDVAISEEDSPFFSITESLSAESTAADKLSDPVVVKSRNPSETESIQATAPSTSIAQVPTHLLYTCPKCALLMKSALGLRRHLNNCYPDTLSIVTCPHCSMPFSIRSSFFAHLKQHDMTCTFELTQGSEIIDSGDRRQDNNRFVCGICSLKEKTLSLIKKHMKATHNVTSFIMTDTGKVLIVNEAPKKQPVKRKLSGGDTPAATKKRFSPHEVNQLPINPILDDFVYCSLCEFNTKVRLNMVRHLQLHAEQQPVPQTAPVNPVPHLETNEMHFNKMLNLASSSIAKRPDKQIIDNPVVASRIPHDITNRYPKYVPDPQRFACGAKGCSYIPVDESMFRCHWETMHAGTSGYHCLHCPPYQYLVTSKPLTASRIIGHLKMHDAYVYACSLCSYYHYKLQTLEKHIKEEHRNGKIIVVREGPLQAGPILPPPNAPTMDLKPWQCGLCEFKNMLRQTVVEHCANTHRTKMQYKCAYCPFRTSTIENVTRHQASSHTGRSEEIIYFYYREGSLLNDPDGMPRWKVQRKLLGIQEVKIEENPTLNVCQSDILPAIDLNIVKKEIVDVESLDELEKKFGEFCDPNGLSFKCPLCHNFTEEKREAMKSHLFEELGCRKWGCSICSYKAFHKTGLSEHMRAEHFNINSEPRQLSVDASVEVWVNGLLDHQAKIVEESRENFKMQKIHVEKPSTETESKCVKSIPEASGSKTMRMKDLEQAFGSFGISSSMQFCCPKCNVKFQDENSMRVHLEIELTKIRWCCSICSNSFQTFHEALTHCKVAHMGQPARPTEAIRDINVRNAWVAAVIQVQKLSMNYLPVTTKSPIPQQNIDAEPEYPDNSLLMVRYEETLANPEDITMNSLTQNLHKTGTDSEKMPPLDEADSDSISGEETVMKKKLERQCKFCIYKTAYPNDLHKHVLRHYNLKLYGCPLCDFGGPTKKNVSQHIQLMHIGSPLQAKKNQIPQGPPLVKNLSLHGQFSKKKTEEAIVDDESRSSLQVCLVCEQHLKADETSNHKHGEVTPSFLDIGTVVIKCCNCFNLYINFISFQSHNCLTGYPENYMFYKIGINKRMVYACCYCEKSFRLIKDIRCHSNSVHMGSRLKYYMKPFSVAIEIEKVEGKRKIDNDLAQPQLKRIAKKSTTKLPMYNSVAKKSTTKLPHTCDSDSDSTEEEYSFYSSRPTFDNLDKITTLMPFCNTLMPFTYKKLQKIINIEPKLLIKDIQK